MHEKGHTPMAERTVLIGSTHGLHARPARLFTQAASDSGLEVTLAAKGGTVADAASILGVISLGINFGDEVTLTAEGTDADLVLDTLAGLLTTDHDAQA